MLLEVNCSLEHYMEFLNKAEEKGVKPDFDMHGADQNSSFGLVASENSDIPTSGSETIIDDDGNVVQVDRTVTVREINLDEEGEDV